MRFAPLLAAILLVAGCSSTQPYSRRDLQQVREAYATIVPLYLDFKRAAIAGNNREIVRDYHREVVACRVNDAVDRRDTIDATTNLFAVSAEIDDLCNTMDSAYTGWARAHGRPYPKDVVPGRLADEFISADKDLVLMPQQMAHPKQQY
jgi:hypothetical protein